MPIRVRSSSTRRVRSRRRALRGLSRQIGVSQKQARPLDAGALAAIRATALSPRKSRCGLLEMEETAIRRVQLNIALASVMSDAGLRISEAADLRWCDVLDAEDGAGLIYIERSKTDRVDEGTYPVVTPDTLAALKVLRRASESWADDDPAFGLSMPQISRRVDSRLKLRDWVGDTLVTPAAWASLSG